MTPKLRVPASVCLIGPINVDVTMPIDAFPQEGDDAGAPSYSVETGGVVGNTAIALSKLGVNAKLIGCIGDDIWGKLAADAFEETGYDQYLTFEYFHPYPHYPEALIHQTSDSLDRMLGRLA